MSAGIVDAMLEIDSKSYIFRLKEIWFSERPYDVGGCDAVWFLRCESEVDMKGFSYTQQTTSVIDLTQELDEIWKAMSKSSCRYAVGRAHRDGIKVDINENYEEFSSINESFRLAKGLGRSQESLVDEVRKHGYWLLFTASHEGEVLAGQVYITDGRVIRWRWGASKRLEVDEKKATLIGNANRLMIWQAIEYAKRLGMKEFDMGGITLNPNDSITKFKLSFGGQVRTCFNYNKIYSRLYKYATKVIYLKSVFRVSKDALTKFA